MLNLGPYQSDFGINVAYFLPVLSTTIFFFLVFHYVLRNKDASTIVRLLAGIVSAFAPAVAWWLIRYSRPHFFHNLDHIDWLLVEITFAALCVVLYGLKHWPISIWTSLLILAIHGAIWWRAYAISVAFSFPALFSIPIASLLSTLAWGSLVRQGTC
jgi:hypothetical protein